MEQLFGAVFAIMLTLGLFTLSIRMMNFNEGRNAFYYNVWWYMTGVSVLAIMVALITAGAVIQRLLA